MSPFSHPAHRTGQADFPHPALGQDFTLARATPSAASEHLSELIGFPISRSFTTYCVCLELRSDLVVRSTRYEALDSGSAASGWYCRSADHRSGVMTINGRLHLELLRHRLHSSGLTLQQ